MSESKEAEPPKKLRLTQEVGWESIKPLAGDTIVCSYQLGAYASTSDEGHHNPYAELVNGKAFPIAYAGLNTSHPTMKGNLGEAPLVKAAEDEDQIVLVERNALGNVFTHTISRSLRRAIWTKSYFGPYAWGSVYIGVCQ